MPNLFVKDESQLPTGSFKSRGMTAAVSMAKWLGVKRVALPTAGNAGGAAAAYAARAPEWSASSSCPHDTPVVNQFEAVLYGAKAFRVNGLINDCGKIVKDGAERMGWFDLSTLKEPYRLEGKKTMGLELAEQMGWTLPDVIFYPTGGGTGLIGMWKAFRELAELGWLQAKPERSRVPNPGCVRSPARSSPARPRAARRSSRAFEKGERFAELFPNASTVASGLRVPVGGRRLHDARRDPRQRRQGGRPAAKRRSPSGCARASSAEGISVCPETAVCFDVLERHGRRPGEVQTDERVVVFNTGAAPKYLEALPVELPAIDKDRVDWEAIATQ